MALLTEPCPWHHTLILWSRRSKVILAPSMLLQVPGSSFWRCTRKLHRSTLNRPNASASCWRVLHSFLQALSGSIHTGQHSHFVFSMPSPTTIPATHLLHSATQAKQPPYATESIVSSSVSFFARGHERILGTGGCSQSPRFCFIICVHLQPSYVTVSFSRCYRQSLSVPKNIFNSCT